jgi:multidrug transporter EmrE-like cation transporter
VLQSIPVSIAYPMLSLNFVCDAGGVGIWREPARRHWLGVGLIVVGIVILAVSDGLNLGVIQRRPASGAQLLLRSAMVELPPLTEIFTFLIHLLHLRAGTFGLAFGLMGYLLSMVCWYFALHQLPLAKAYALLSLSYILVWAAAIWLPGWHEPSTGNRCWACC